MKSLRLSELRELVHSAEFANWWDEFIRAGTEVTEKAQRADELQAQATIMDQRAELAQRHAADTLSRAGEFDDEAARLSAEAQEIENRSLELIGQYEEFRFKVSDIWYRLGAAERNLEEMREAPAVPIPEAPKSPAKGGPKGSKKGGAKQKAEQREILLKQAERNYTILKQEYERESRRKGELWNEVEQLWERTFAIALLTAERSADAKRVRRDSERLFQEAEERRTRARQLRQESEAGVREDESARLHARQILAGAREKLGCIPGERFLYWRQKENEKGAYALALFDDAETYNIEVKALAIYSVSRQRGVGFLELARAGMAATAEEGDRRFEEYFLGPRKGAVRAPVESAQSRTAG